MQAAGGRPPFHRPPEEVLLRLRALRGGYDVSFSAGLSFTFGSLFNNVVNPRFNTGDEEDFD